MQARWSKFLQQAGDTFWLLPAAMVVGGLIAAEALVQLERAGLVSTWLLDGWLYTGGGSGARTLLGAVAASTIGVAGTIFSITIASLTLASSQMGPRLLTHFTRDRGNQLVLGLYLGTFAFALMVLRTVRDGNDTVFVPHLAVTVALALAMGCVAMLVFFVAHVADRINVDTVIDLVHEDLRSAIKRLTDEEAGPPASMAHWPAAASVIDRRHGYLQQLAEGALADWAQNHDLALRLLIRPGDFVFPGAAVLEASKAAEGMDEVLRDATAVGGKRVDSADLAYSVRQLVDVAVRALSPGINDPQTAVSVTHRLGAALCEIAGRHLPSGVIIRDGRAALTRPALGYDELADVMLDPIRQNARDATLVLMTLMEVLTAVASIEQDTDRRKTLTRHAALVLAAAERDCPEASSVARVRRQHKRFMESVKG